MRAKLSIYRFDPDSNQQPRYDTFEIDADPGETCECSHKGERGLRFEPEFSVRLRR